MAIAAALAAGGSILSNLMGYLSNERTNALNRMNVQETNKANEHMQDRSNFFNREIARETNEMNERVAMENLGFQRELQEYQKELQKQQWEREDTSYQRTAQDMLAAGLNPLDMQGTNGAGEVVSMSPLENTFQAQQSAPMGASRNESFQAANSFNSAIQASSAVASMAQMFNQVETGALTRDSMQLDNDKKILENAILAHDYGIDIFGKGKNRSIGMSYIGNNDYDWSNSKGWKNSANLEAYNNAYIERMNKQREYTHKDNAGIYDTDTDFERVITALSDWINNGRGVAEWKKLENTFPFLKAFKLY